ncbi:hypothetical protein Tsp_15072 [Trichinella spiralis]|uniref:hypothetical protein n=1 Tax=Trichinella spiralis TaxID=6334 RepID=UPI0001EFE0C1|nr:hypothetical protein Tsp_15072 [Trichinella spiralis]
MWRQSSSAGVRTDLSRVLFVYNSCGLRHPMKLGPFATRVHMDGKAFSSRPSVPLLITFTKNEFDIVYGSHEMLPFYGTLALRFLPFCFSLSRKFWCVTVKTRAAF